MDYKFIGNYRIKKIRDVNGKINWLFLPGGPGIGSEYLELLINELKIPDNLFVGDFPGDGSNRNTDNISYDLWKNGLLQVVSSLQPCVLVTHSFSGMFVLSISELEELLSGLVIMNSAPDKGWMDELERTIKIYNLPASKSLGIDFYKAPTNQHLEVFFQESVPYLFLPHEVEAGKEILKVSSYNAKSKLWSDQYFHPNYFHAWCPEKLPMLIISSKDDRLCPAKLFLEQEKWQRKNIQMLVLENAGHFSWLSKFREINNSMNNFSKRS